MKACSITKNNHECCITLTLEHFIYSTFQIHVLLVNEVTVG